MNGFPAHGFCLLCVCVWTQVTMCVSVLLSHWPDKPSLILSEDQCAAGHTHTHTHTLYTNKSVCTISHRMIHIDVRDQHDSI